MCVKADRMVIWCGVMAPAALPEPLRAKLARETLAVLDRSETGERITQQGATVRPRRAADVAADMAAEHAKFGEVIRTARIRPQ